MISNSTINNTIDNALRLISNDTTTATPDDNSSSQFLVPFFVVAMIVGAFAWVSIIVNCMRDCNTNTPNQLPRLPEPSSSSHSFGIFSTTPNSGSLSNNNNSKENDLKQHLLSDDGDNTNDTQANDLHINF